MESIKFQIAYVRISVESRHLSEFLDPDLEILDLLDRIFRLFLIEQVDGVVERDSWIFDVLKRFKNCYFQFLFFNLFYFIMVRLI
jgi:hypothetical protein